MTRFDLHTHTHYSDGVLSPGELVLLARDKGVDVLAVTDHDSVAGLDEAANAACDTGITLIPGVEISVTWNQQVLHVVGLNVEPGNKRLLAGLETNTDRRCERAEKMYTRFDRQGIPLREEVERHAGPAAPTRTHFARALVETGRVKDLKQAFRRYLGRGKPCHVIGQWASLEDAVKWILAAGGTAVLAHPLAYKLTRTRLRQVVQGLVDAGGQAIEVVTGNTDKAQARALAVLADEFSLHGSVGSDFHSPEQRWAMVGRCGALPDGVTPVWDLWS